MKLNVMVGNVVGRADPSRSGVVVVELPRDNFAVCSCRSLYINYAGGSKVGPGELLFTRPNELHGFASCLGQARGFNGSVPHVLPAVCCPGVRDDHAYLLFGNAKCRREFLLHAKWSLRPRPDGELVSIPFSNRGAWFQWTVCDVGNCVGFIDRLVSGSESSLHVTCDMKIAFAGALLGFVLQMFKKLGVADLRRRIPFGAQSLNSSCRGVFVGRNGTDKFAVTHYLHPCKFFCLARIERD